jgi:CheY-like chemotaxis protein
MDVGSRDALWLVIDADPYVGKLVDRHVQGGSVVQLQNLSELDGAMKRYRPQGIIYNNPFDAAIPELLDDAPVPVVVCSLPSTTQMVTRLGVDACLAKPILPQQLIERIEEYPSLKSVLVIDDDVGVVQLVQRTLEHRFPDLGIQRAYNGQQAREMIDAAPPDLILLDLVMPTMSGFEVIAHLKADERLRAIPIILLTATKYIQSDEETRGDLRIHRCGGLKPTEVLKLLDMITQSVGAWG